MGEEVAVALLNRYNKIAFTVLSQCPLILTLEFSSYFSSSTGTGTSEDNALVALGAVQ